MKSKNKKFKLLILLFGICMLTILCKEDAAQNPQSEAEKKHYEDYISPEKKWSFIDTENQIICGYKYDDLRDFKEGLAAANFKGKWGFINTSAKEIIPHKYRAVKSFNTDIVFAQDFDGIWQAIDNHGKLILSTDFNAVSYFDKDLVVGQKDIFWGVTDLNGKEILPFKFKNIKVTSDLIFAKENEYYSIFDKAGTLIRTGNFDQIFPNDISEPIRFKENGKYGFMSTAAEPLIPAKYDKAFNFDKGQTVIKINGSFKAIDKKGNEKFTLDYDNIMPAGDGKWRYKQNEKWGLVDGNGNEITNADFYLLNRYSDGFISFAIQRDRWGYLDSDGRIAIPAIFPLSWDYKNGFVRYIEPQGIGFLNKAGKAVIPPMYFEVRDFYEGYARVQKR